MKNRRIKWFFNPRLKKYTENTHCFLQFSCFVTSFSEMFNMGKHEILNHKDFVVLYSGINF